MSAARTSVHVVGVGGQGSVFVARALGEAALRSGVGVVVSELHGMAQRGGVVESTVVLGEAHGPIVPRGEADVLVALEPLEAVRSLSAVRKGGAGVVGLEAIVPFTVSIGAPPYPDVEGCLARVRAWLGQVVALELGALAEAAGARLASGAVALGALAGLSALPLDEAALRAATLTLAPAKAREANAAAFDAGLAASRRRGGDRGATPRT